jgi:hypothetical protein
MAIIGDLAERIRAQVHEMYTERVQHAMRTLADTDGDSGAVDKRRAHVMFEQICVRVYQCITLFDAGIATAANEGRWCTCMCESNMYAEAQQSALRQLLLRSHCTELADAALLHVSGMAHVYGTPVKERVCTRTHVRTVNTLTATQRMHQHTTNNAGKTGISTIIRHGVGKTCRQSE